MLGPGAGMHRAAMDLGSTGRVALVTGGSKGIGLGDRGRARRGGRARGGRLARRASACGGGRRGSAGTAFVFDSADLDAVPGVHRRVEAALGPIDIYIANTRRAARRPGPARLLPRAVGGGAPDAVLSPDGVPRAAAARRCASAAGAASSPSASIAVREPIPAIQLSNAHRPGLIAAFKVLAQAGRRRRRDAQHACCRAGSPPTGYSRRRARPRRPRRRRARRCRPGRLGTVEELAAAAVFLCSAPASYITGTTLLVDGGLTVGVASASGLDSGAYGPLAQLAEQGTSGRSASRETASTSAAICWNPLRALGTERAGDNPSGIGRSAGNPAQRESPQRPYAAHPNGTAEGEEMVQTASPRRRRGWPVKAGAAG